MDRTLFLGYRQTLWTTVVSQLQNS